MVRLFGRKEQIRSGLIETRKGLFGRIVARLGRSGVSDATWEELEEALVAADVGARLSMELVRRVRERSDQESARDGATLQAFLGDELRRILTISGQRSPLLPPEGAPPLPASPYVVLFVGVNGSGKTTSIAKLAHLMTQDGKRVLLAAADTFRAAGVEQLEIWSQRVKAQIVAHHHGADPGAVAFDALQAARARGADIVIIDTAGRLHTKVNLMEELKKVRRVVQRFDPAAPHDTLLVLDATTGQNGLAQAKHFSEAIGVTGIFLAKLDGTARGGIAVAIADQLRLPILFVGTGEGQEDIAPFDAAEFVEALLAPEA